MFSTQELLETNLSARNITIDDFMKAVMNLSYHGIRLDTVDLIQNDEGGDSPDSSRLYLDKHPGCEPTGGLSGAGIRRQRFDPRNWYVTRNCISVFRRVCVFVGNC